MSYRRNEIVFKSTPATVGDYKCMVEGCDYVTGSRTGMVLHGRIRHNIRYSREPSVVVHLWKSRPQGRMRSQRVDTEMPRVKILPIRSGMHSEGPIGCPFQGCEHSLRNEIGMRLHMKAAHGVGARDLEFSESGAACSVCAVRFRNVSDMKKHASATNHFLR